MVYCLFHLSPEPALTGPIYLYLGAVLGLVALFALAWVKLIQRRGVFEHDALAGSQTCVRRDHRVLG